MRISNKSNVRIQKVHKTEKRRFGFYTETANFVWRAYQCSVVKVHRGVVTDELCSDSQGLNREVQAKRRDSEIVAWRTETWYEGALSG